MILSDIKREQANAAATLANIDAYVATADLDTLVREAKSIPFGPTVWFLVEEAEGAFIQFQDCAIAMGLKLKNDLPIDMARAYIKSAINNKENRAS